MPIYRKGEDQSPLFTRAKSQEKTHVKSPADSGGYMVGLNTSLKAAEVAGLGETPVSAKGIRMGQDADYWIKKSKN